MAVVAHSGIAVGTTSNDDHVVVTLPSGAVVGDMQVLTCTGNASATVSISTPAGWTVLTASTNPSNTGTMAHANFYRIKQTGDASTVTVTMTSTGASALGRLVVSPWYMTGHASSGMVEAQAVTASGTIADNGNVPAPTLTAASSRFLVTTHGVRTTAITGVADTWTPPSGMTELQDDDTNMTNGTTQVTQSVNTLALSGSGATGVKNAVPTGGGQAVGASFLILAASAVTQSASATLNITSTAASSYTVPTAMQYLQDDFTTDRLATLWPASSGATVTGGQAVIATSTIAGDNALRSAFAWSLKNSYIQLAMNAPLAAGSTSAYGRLLVRPNSAGVNVQIRADNATGTIFFEVRDAAGGLVTDPSDTGVVSMARDATQMHCLQIAEANGRIFFQTSPDGTQWVTRRSTPTPSWVTATPNLRVDVTAFKNAGTADSVEVDNVNLLTAAAPPPPPPPPPAVIPDPTPTPGPPGNNPTGFAAIVDSVKSPATGVALTHYYPLDDQAANLVNGRPADTWGRNTHDSYMHSDFVGSGVSIGPLGATTNGSVANGYLKIPHHDDFSIASTANGGPTNGAMTIVVFVSILNWHNTTNGTEYLHWMGKGTYGNAAGGEDPVDSLEWGARHYISPPNSGEATTRPGRTSIYYWPPDGGTGNGAYCQGGANGVPTSFQFSTAEFMLTLRMDSGTQDSINCWWNNINSNDQSINSGTNVSWNGPHTLERGAVRIGKRGQNAANSGAGTVKVRRLMFFKGYLPSATINTLYNNRALAEGTMGGAPTLVAPGVIQNLVMGSTNTTVTGTWDPPATAGTAAIGFYDLTLTASGQATQTFTITNHADLASRTHTFTGLASGVSYTLGVAARSTDGTSTAVTQSVTTAPTKSAPPTVLGVSAGNTQLVLSWTPPINNGGSPITRYDVTMTPAGGSPTTVPVTFPAAGTTITGLTNGVTYGISVVAVNGVGPSDPLTGSGIPVSTVSVPSPPATVNVTAGDGQVVATWPIPPGDGGSPIRDYTAVIAGPTTETKPGLTARTATFSGLTNGGAYTVTVQARNDIGLSTGTTSSTVTPFVLPSVPNSLSHADGNAQTFISWTAPTTLGTGGVTSYHVVIKDPSGATVATVDTTPTAQGAPITGLTNGVIYSALVNAVSGFGSGPTGTIANIAPLAPPVFPPSIPVSFDTQPGVSGAVNLSWAAPVDDGGSVLLGYDLTVKVTATGSVVDTDSFLDTVTDATVTGLTNGTSYTFSLVARNSAGTSPAAIKTAIPVEPAAPPGPIEDPVAAATNDHTVTLVWAAPLTGSAVETYEISSVPLTQVLTVPGTQTSVTITGLRPETSYTFTITGQNLYGDGTSTDITVTTPPVFVPPPPVLPVPNMFAFPQPSPTDTPRVFRPANFGKTIGEVPVGD